MRRCIYHTDLGQKSGFHNFSRQIALSQYSGRSITETTIFIHEDKY